MVTCISPLVIYLYEDGIVRFATEAYETHTTAFGDGLERRCMHLTNVSVTQVSRDPGTYRCIRVT